ncbi:MAG: hypothetical protein HKO62_04120 [Gammaproteobacteria bacterium]|nr:hypothetical protein [Gammaproteobacteria bacterium]NNL99913.1 hypothetical protein [Gammaproteobacteria bacterium]
MNHSGNRSTFIGLCLGLTLPLVATGQTSVYTYPVAGQSQEQQSRDRFECHSWAVNQSGFDPTTATPIATTSQPPPPDYRYDDRPPPPRQNSSFLGLGNGGIAPGSGAVGDTATGAALGAAGGAIAGDAGKGAAIGAVSGLLFGALSRSSQQQQAQAQPQRRDNSYEREQYYARKAEDDRRLFERQEQVGSYRRAFGACMTARDYSVQ